jgi:LPS O-antigen subunit length determinant protein (WzzB/FepE family)
MNNTYKETYDASNDLSLRDFVFFFWHNKIWFFIATLIGVVIGIITFFMLSNWQKAELRVYPISLEKLATLDEVSRLAAVNLPANLPMDLFFQTLQNRSKLAKSVALEADKNSLDEESTSDFLSRINTSRREPSETQNEVRNALLDYIDVSFKTTNFNKESVLLISSLNRLENEAAQILKDQFLFRISEIEEGIENQKKYLQLKIDNARFSYQEKLNIQLSNLLENIKIAKTLGIKNDQILENTSGAQSSSSELPAQDNTNITLFALEPSSIPIYYRGYVALQTQYDLISERSDIDGFIPELATLKSELNSLENSRTVELLKRAYAKSILGKDEPIVIVEANNMISKRQIPAIAMLILPVFLMLLITSVFLIIRQIIRSNRN